MGVAQDIQVVVREVMSGIEFDMDLPVTTTAGEIIEAAINDPSLNIPKTDPAGQPYIFELKCKETGGSIAENMSLSSAGVRNGNTLLFIPKLIAGGE